MKIIIKTTLDSTPSLKIYIESKLEPLAKFITKFDKAGEADVWLELSRTTKHHRKGEVFKAAADLRLKGKTLHGEAYAEDIRSAIDEVRNELKTEIGKHKTKMLDRKKGERNK